ncbi:hypothetical protein VF12_41125 [Nostoc linckia z15]|nr:hypothetical protein VF12_41125 [Nostoc linckia z15]
MGIGEMMDYIINRQLTGRVAIMLHPDNFDDVSASYFDEPVEIMGISVMEDTTGRVNRDRIHLVEL